MQPVRIHAIIMAGLMLAMVGLSFGSAADGDGDGVEDSSDNCPYSYGNSTVDRTGCPDRDGDGTSDWNDGWTSNNPDFAKEVAMTSSFDYWDVDHSPDGLYVVSSDENGYIRIREADTGIIIRSVQAFTDDANQIAWSGDGQYIGVGTDGQDTAKIYWASNLTVLHSSISTDVGGGDEIKDVAFSDDGTMFAIAIGQSGNGGTSGVVRIINSSTGAVISNPNPGGEDRFYSVAFSPSGSHLVAGGDGEAYIVETTNWTTTRTLSVPAGSVNDVAWSADGKRIAVCEGYVQSQGSSRLRVFNTDNWFNTWTKTFTTSCLATDFSPDGKQVIFGGSYYQGDGATSKVFDVDTGNGVDNIVQPRPNNCQGTQGNNCGRTYGLSWAPSGMRIAQAFGTHDEGFYLWFADLDPDDDGWNTSDQGDGRSDEFPDEGTQWNDSDSDGYGDNPLPAFKGDACPNTWGNSWQDRFGCPDGDGDGYSNDGDIYPVDPLQWADSDGDGKGDNYYYDLQPFTELHLNQTGDAFPMDASQWNDTDGDNWGDNFADSSWVADRPADWPGELDSSATTVDKFPLDRYQWADIDGDWIGDNENTPRSDSCVNTWGNSSNDRLGCADSDGDGWSDPTSDFLRHPQGDADAFPQDPTQWRDSDGDGFGDNSTGSAPDDCPGEYGLSSIDRVGCADADGDGWSNSGDPFPQDSTQWSDRDNDGYGDNPDGNEPDIFPDDSSQWADTDGDGHGDRPVLPDGDFYPNDPTQWSDFDADGYGDDKNGNNGDQCPETYGKSTTPESRGCPDTDSDGVVDPFDAFPDDYYQQTDADGDGWGDNQAVTNGDECPDVPGNSTNNSRQGCPDADGDSWADEDDMFPADPMQWIDTDLDGWGDNYGFINKSIADLDNEGEIITIRDQWGDAFISDPSQWADSDGDGLGDNPDGRLPDAFPFRATQWADTDGDKFGDSHVLGAYQPDECEFKFGTSTIDVFGCPDYDEDGVSDKNDPCPYDPLISTGLKSAVTCAAINDHDNDGIPNDIDEDFAQKSEDGADDIGGPLMILIGLSGFLLVVILIAMVAKQAGRRKAAYSRSEDMKVSAMFAEEEGRKQEWIDYYVNQGDTAKAIELGWTAPAAVPQWQQHQQHQDAQVEAAIPQMLNLEDL